MGPPSKCEDRFYEEIKKGFAGKNFSRTSKRRVGYSVMPPRRHAPPIYPAEMEAGDVDYLLKVIVSDMEAFDEFYKRLISTTALNDVTSRFSMETIKETTALPI